MKKGLEWLLVKSTSVGLVALALTSSALGQENPRGRFQIPGRTTRIPIGDIKVLQPGVLQGKAPKVDLSVNSPDIQVLRRARVSTEKFPVADPQTKAKIDPATILTLPDGRKVQAGTYYEELNKIEAGMNELGYSLRTMPREFVLQKNVINTSLLRQQTAQIGAVGPRLSQNILNERFTATPMVNGQRILMAEQLSETSVKAIRTQNVGKSIDLTNNQFRIIPQDKIQRVIPGDIQPIRPPGGVINPRATDRIKLKPGILGNVGGIRFQSPKTFHRENPWNWSVGNPSSFQAYLTGKLVTDGKAYPVANPSDAEINKSASEYTLSGDTQAGGSILGRNLTLVDARAQFYAPSNTTKQLNANARVQVIGITVFNFNQDFPSSWSKSETISKSLHYGVPFGIPLGPIWLGGEIGANGEAGLKYSVSMNRTGVGGNITPFVRAGVYGEGGASIVIAGAGVGVQMTLLNAELDLYGQARLGWFIKWIFMQNFYVGYKINMLSGRAYGYVYVYVPCWGIPPWEKKQWEHDFWNWGGFTKEGTLVDYQNNFVFENWDSEPVVSR
ncbi:hypothetical protein EON83_03860 [bacterium]|nr:MAG: hypothetical protein EON83_03860 [bacterium]